MYCNSSSKRAAISSLINVPCLGANHYARRRHAPLDRRGGYPRRRQPACCRACVTVGSSQGLETAWRSVGGGPLVARMGRWPRAIGGRGVMQPLKRRKPRSDPRLSSFGELERAKGFEPSTPTLANENWHGHPIDFNSLAFVLLNANAVECPSAEVDPADCAGAERTAGEAGWGNRTVTRQGRRLQRGRRRLLGVPGAAADPTLVL